MVIHIGGNNYVSAMDVVFIINSQSVQESQINADIISAAKLSCQFEGDEENAQCFVGAYKNGEVMIYSSPISTKTLVNRLEFF